VKLSTAVHLSHATPASQVHPLQGWRSPPSSGATTNKGEHDGKARDWKHVRERNDGSVVELCLGSTVVNCGEAMTSRRARASAIITRRRGFISKRHKQSRPRSARTPILPFRIRNNSYCSVFGGTACSFSFSYASMASCLLAANMPSFLPWSHDSAFQFTFLSHP
jgi:hypothetical protein